MSPAFVFSDERVAHVVSYPLSLVELGQLLLRDWFAMCWFSLVLLQNPVLCSEKPIPAIEDKDTLMCTTGAPLSSVLYNQEKRVAQLSFSAEKAH